jgi:hypothetical protein
MIIVLSKIPPDKTFKCPVWVKPRAASDRTIWEGLSRGAKKQEGPCYYDIPCDTKIRQYIDTNCPATLVEVLKFMGRFAPPGLGDVLVWVKKSKMRNMPYTVVLQFTYTAPYKDIGVLTWLSFVRAGWEGLAADDVTNKLPTSWIIMNGQKMGGGHYPYPAYDFNAVTGMVRQRPPLNLHGMFSLLRALKADRFNVRKQLGDYRVINKKCCEILGMEAQP